jgi:hypothetical protein
MLPEGAVHLPCEFMASLQLKLDTKPNALVDKGIAKVAKQLGIDYAEACVRRDSVGSLRYYDLTCQCSQTGFEFKKQRAIPVLTGIAVATEYEDLVMEVSESRSRS